MYHEISVFDGKELKKVYMPADQYTQQEALQAIKDLYPNQIVAYERSVMT